MSSIRPTQRHILRVFGTIRRTCRREASKFTIASSPFLGRNPCQASAGDHVSSGEAEGRLHLGLKAVHHREQDSWRMRGNPRCA